MIRRLLILAALGWCGSAAAAAAERCALVVASQPEPDSAALEAARRSLAGRCRFIDDAAVRGVLERFERPPPPEERARDALKRAHARMRRFDASGVHQALDEARAAAAEVSPTAEGRQLFVQLALQEAELANVERDAAAELRAMRLALAIDPELRLDDGRASPAVLALLGRARQELARARRLPVSIESQPDGARVWAGTWRGDSPVAVELAEGPAIVWLTRAGYRGRALPIAVTPGAKVTAVLEPLNDAERLRPLVDSVRQTPRDGRLQPALALAGALGVGAVVVVEPGAAPPVVYAAAPQLALPPARSGSDLRLVGTSPPPWRPWYKRSWPWVLIAGGAALAATAVGVGVVYGTGQVATLSCCR